MTGVLNNRVAVITGSGAGIGRATALAMAREGARIVINDIVSENAAKVVGEIRALGGEAIAFTGDISNFQTAEKLFQTVADRYGKIDILHNNAGIVTNNPVWEFTERDWDSVIAVNLKGTFNCIRHASPYMIKQKWGRIINVSSGARIGMPGNVSYSTSKAGILGLTGTVALELAPYSITCNAYQPTAATQFTLAEHVRAGFDEGYRHGLIPRELYQLLMNPPPPETIPPLVMYLCTEDAANINGKTFDILGDSIAVWAEPSKKYTIFNKGGWTVEELKKVVPAMLKQS